MRKKIKIAFISDTHCKHMYLDKFFKENKVDILIHSGDGSNSKVTAINNNELRDCLTWISSLKNIKHKIFIPGNHDVSYQHGLVKQEDFPKIKILVNDFIKIYPSIFSKKPIIIYGSPITPTFGTGWAYNCHRHKINKWWELIPIDTNILVTHGPPKGILDHTEQGRGEMVSVGCKSLMNKVLEIQPEYHIFGHLHDESIAYNHGIKTIGNKCKTKFINASIVNLRHQVINEPIIIEY